MIATKAESRVPEATSVGTSWPGGPEVEVLHFGVGEQPAIPDYGPVESACGGPPRPAELHGLGSDDGGSMWVVTLPWSSSGEAVVTDDSIIYVVGSNWELAASVISIDFEGRPRWQSSMTWQPVGTPLVAGDMLVLPVEPTNDQGDIPGGVVALDRSDGQLVWAAPLAGAPVRRPPGLVASAHLVMAADYSGHVTAIDLTSGAEAWQVTIGGDLNRPPRLVGDTLFVAARSSLLAVEAATGSIQWTSEPPDPGSLIDEVIGASDGTVLAVAENASTMEDGDRFLVAGFEIGDGAQLWETEVSEWAVVAADVLVTADRDPQREDGSPARPIRAWSASTGDALWGIEERLLIRSLAWDGAYLFLATPSVNGRTGAIGAFDPGTGATAWMAAVDGTVTASPLVVPGQVIAPSRGPRVEGKSTGIVTSLDRTSGVTLWMRSLDLAIRGTPAMADDVVVVLAADEPIGCI